MNQTIPSAPPDHPSVKHGRIGVLLTNLGTPDGYTYRPMRRYLSEFLSDKRVIDYPAWKWQPILQLIILSKRPFTSGANYRSIWNSEKNESPLLTISREQCEKLRRSLGGSVSVEFGMRYGNPSSADRLKQMQADGCDRILHFPLYPQYSASTTGSANDAVFRAMLELKWQPALRTVPPYFDHPTYIGALARSLKSGLERLDFDPDAIVASYHGLPQRYLLEGDPYYCHCRKTSRLLTGELGWTEERLITTFQSRFGSEEWLQPYTVEKVAELARSGRRRIAVAAPGFAADNIETLEEIQGEIREAFESAGGDRFAYIPCLNASDDHIGMIAEIVMQNLAGWTG
ncbi:MAG: ferrochelatase [Rhodobacteraceae bacterium]|nr:ferrochelatase [Paracoccaceae bacterium]